MPRRQDPFREVLEGVETVPLREDTYEAEQVQFITRHPAFAPALDRLREELAEVGFLYVEPAASAEAFDEPQDPHIDPPSAVPAATASPEKMPYPVRAFSAEWGLSAVAVLYLLMNEPTRARTEAFSVTREPTQYVIRMPRPITTARKNALQEWLKTRVHDQGRTEEIWDVKDKVRFQCSPNDVATIPSFLRWNAGDVEPIELWREGLASGSELRDDAFVARLTSVWERMRRISPDRTPIPSPPRARADGWVVEPA